MYGSIYKITNKINGKIYIGQTIQKPIERFYQHCAKSAKCEVLNMPIHKAILKYGKNNFSFEILETINKNKLNERERYWISYYDSYNSGYNATFGGQKGAKPFKYHDDDAIIESYKNGSSLRNIGSKFNLDKDTIKSVLIRNNIKLRTTRTYKLSQDDRVKLIDEYKNGFSRKDLMLKWNISKSYLSQLINSSRRI